MRHESQSTACFVALTWFILFSTAAICFSNDAAPKSLDFNRDVRPILANACLQCHGADEESREAELRLDERESATSEHDSGVTIVPGNHEESVLFQRLVSDDPDERMPPADAGKKITPDQIELLKRWITEGATYEQHWSFAPPQRPRAPTVKNESWVKNDIDRFALAQLEAEGMKPAPEADRYTLVRRVSLDLRGLPPTIDEADQFVRDRSPQAYENMVDRMLASRHYGERMAVLWMDLARYGDTNGYHYDSTRQAWLWRDWVIKAYNDNMPFDQFTIEQLGGDLLPDATIQQQVASGFNRNTRYNEEGGSDPAEFRVRYAVDRTNTLGQVWLGLTLGCCECHSHKYDPITHKEYYQLYAFFNSLDEPGSEGHNQIYEPIIKVPQPKQEESIADAHSEIANIEKRIETELEKISYVEPTIKPDMLDLAGEIVWVDDLLPAGAQAQGGPLEWVEAADGPVLSGSRSLKRIARGTQQYYFEDTPQRLQIGAGDRLFVHVYVDPNDLPEEIMVQFNSASAPSGWRHRAYWGANRITWGRDNTTERMRLGDLPSPGEWVRLEIPAQQVGLQSGMYVTGLAFTQHGGTAYWDRAGIVSRVRQGPHDVVWIDDDVPSGAQLAGNGQNPDWHWVGGSDQPVYSGLRSMRRSAKGLNQHYFTAAANPLVVDAGDTLFAYVYIDPKDPPQAIQLQFNDGSWSHRASWGAPDVAHGAGKSGGANYHAGPLPKAGQWVRLEVPVEKVGLTSGAKLNGWAFTQFDGTVYYDKAGVRTWNTKGGTGNAELSQLAWERQATGDESLPQAVQIALKIAPKNRAPIETKAVRDHYLRYSYGATRATFDPLNQQIEALRDKIKRTEDSIPFQLVSVELKEPKPAHVLMRGNFQQLGEKVQRDVPVIFPSFPVNQPRNRLGLAHWLTDPANPLVARVQVNRFWAQLFGQGIVPTIGNFGSQGTFPTHPQLLDWLATEFTESGWDVKHTLKTIVMSATYRQASITGNDYREKDPDNTRLWKAPRVRLAAETIRDNALSIAGLLSHEIGGPPVFPYQPTGYYLGKAPGGMNSRWPWKTSDGTGLYRRGMYTFWRRTTPYPTFVIFDAPDRANCTVARPRTNSPLQALVTLNDPQFVEAARVMAQRVLTEETGELAERLRYAFRIAVARLPSDEELATLRTTYQKQRKRFEANHKAAESIVQIGKCPQPKGLDVVEHAAWTGVCNVILNLDEVITRE